MGLSFSGASSLAGKLDGADIKGKSMKDVTSQWGAAMTARRALKRESVHDVKTDDPQPAKKK